MLSTFPMPSSLLLPLPGRVSRPPPCTDEPLIIIYLTGNLHLATDGIQSPTAYSHRHSHTLLLYSICLATGISQYTLTQELWYSAIVQKSASVNHIRNTNLHLPVSLDQTCSPGLSQTLQEVRVNVYRIDHWLVNIRYSIWHLMRIQKIFVK